MFISYGIKQTTPNISMHLSFEVLKPKVVENVAANLRNERDRQKRYYDQHTKRTR